MSPDNRPADIQRTELIRMFEVPECENVFVLGCFAKALTIYSQQVRALNLVDALVKEGRLTESSRVAVIGAGFGGLTAAAASVVRGAREVAVFEKTGVLIPIQRQSEIRYVHPHIYEWPYKRISDKDAGLPLLNWKADTASGVARQVTAAWEALLKLQHITDRVKVKKGCGAVSFMKNGERSFLIAGDERQYDLIILAVGFGKDHREPETLGYWEDPKKDFERDDKKTWCFAGIGDGGLTDLMWRCFITFHHQTLLTEIDGRLDQADFELLQKISSSNDGTVPGSNETVEQSFRRLAAKLDPLHWEMKGVKKVYLIGPQKDLYSDGRSVLNRLIVSYLHYKNAFEFISGKLMKVVNEDDKFTLTINGDDGTTRTEECDNLIQRYGAKSVLESDFNEIYTACDELIKKWGSISVGNDISRRPLYKGQDYELGMSVDENERSKLRTRANVDGKVGCIVVKSSTDEIAVPLEKWVGLGLSNFKLGAGHRFPDRDILISPYHIFAHDCFADAERYEWTVRAICDCELAVFDLTGNEPGVLTLLGIRAAVRRGVTVTVSQTSEAFADLPYNITGLNPLRLEDPNFAVSLSIAFDKGIAALQAQPEFYLDLPVFDAIRRLGDEVGMIPAQQEVLMLCWFDHEYQKRVCSFIRESIRQIFADKKNPSKVVTTLDNVSPQLVIQRLYSSIRRTQLCLVDWTGWRPNVFFELGVRLAVNDIDPIHFLISDKPKNWHKIETEWPRPSIIDSTFETFFTPFKFPIDKCERLEQCLIQFKSGGAREVEGAKISSGRTFRIVQECIRLRSGDGEPGLYSPDELLLTSARTLNGPAGPEKGTSPVLYPDGLSSKVRQIALENLLAAWFYLVGRYPGLSSPAIGKDQLDEARKKLFVIAYEIDTRYSKTDKWPDDIKLIVADVIKIRAINQEPYKTKLIDQARHAKNDAIKFRDGKTTEVKEPNYEKSVEILEDMLRLIQRELDRYITDYPSAKVDGLEGEIANQAVHLNGTLGGVYRRWGKLDKAIESYAAGAQIEENDRYELKETYTSTQYAVARCLAKAELIAEAALTEDSPIRTELTGLRERIFAFSNGDVYKAADLAIVSLLLRHSEWRRNIIDFMTMAKNRSEDYARQVSLKVVEELEQAVCSLNTDLREQLPHWAEAKKLLL